MNTLKTEKYSVNELNYTEIKVIKGGWCSFAYDIGSALRIMGAFYSGPGNVIRIQTEVAIYDHHCN
jgi:hypothetical protein